MMRFLLLILLISANCMKMNCDEEPSTTETTNEVFERTELFSEDPKSLQNNADSEASKMSEDEEEKRVSRSSTLSTTTKTLHEESSKVDDTDVSFAEKSAPEEVTIETRRQANEEVIETKVNTNSADILQDETKLVENVETQLEELPVTPGSTSDIEDRKPEDLLEASAESKLSDNEKASYKVDETDRNSEITEINENSDESGLDESLDTRRMLSSPDYIVINTKMRADTTSNAVEPEIKTAFNQNLNTYNNFNEFETDSNIKLINYYGTEPTPAITSMPAVTKVASQEILNQMYFPKFYPRPELNINFPNVNSDFQGPRDLPVYLKVKQDEIQTRNQFIPAQSQEFKAAEENTYAYFNPRNQQLHHQAQNVLKTPESLTNTQHQVLRLETGYQIPRYYPNQASTNFETVTNNKQITNVNQNSRNQVQQFNQNEDNIYSNSGSLAKTNHDPRIQPQGMVNSKFSQNNNGRSNRYTLPGQFHGIKNSNKNLETKQTGTEHFKNPYHYLQLNPQLINILRAPTRYYKDNILPQKIKQLIQRVSRPIEYPTKFPINLYGSNNIQHYPYIIHPQYRADTSVYGFTRIPGFQYPT